MSEAKDAGAGMPGTERAPGDRAGDSPIEARALVQSYPSAAGPPLRVLRGIDLEVRSGEAVAIVGASGSGKSTLLHLLGALDRPTLGTVLIDGSDVSGLSDEEAAAVRTRRIGFVFQFHHLLGDFTALENAMIPAMINSGDRRAASERASTLLEAVGLGGRLDHKPSQLSGGEQQRVAVARALVNEPPVVLADEPTGDLDTATSREVQDILFSMRERRGVALVVATHNRELADRADRILRLREGALEDVSG